MKILIQICLLLALLSPPSAFCEINTYRTGFTKSYTHSETENEATIIATAKVRHMFFNEIGNHIKTLNIIDTVVPDDGFFAALALGIIEIDEPSLLVSPIEDGYKVTAEASGRIDTDTIKTDLMVFKGDRLRFNNALANRELEKKLFFALDKLKRAYERISVLTSQSDVKLHKERIKSNRRRIVHRLAAIAKNDQILTTMDSESYADPVGNLKELYKAIDLDSQNEFLYIHRGRIEGGLMDTKAAKWDFSKAIEMNPYSSLAFYFRGRYFLSQKDYERGLEDLNQSIALDTSFDQVYLARGGVYREIDKHSQAIRDFTQAIRLNPQNHAGYIERGLTYFDTGEYQRAIKDYDAAIAIIPENARIYFRRGEAHLKIGVIDKACNDFRKACELGDCSGLHQAMADTTCIAQDRAAAQAWTQKSYTAVVAKNWDDAVAAASLAISHYPGMIEAFINRAWAYAETGEYEKAIQDCDKASAIDPKRAAIYNNRGLAYQRQGNKDRANQDYLKACQLGLEVGCKNYLEINQPSEDNVAKVNQLLIQSANKFKQKDWDAVLRITARVLKIDPTNSVAHANRSAAFSYMKLLDKALAEADKAIEINAKFGLAYNNRGYALEQMGKMTEALVDYRLGCLYGSSSGCDNFNRIKQ